MADKPSAWAMERARSVRRADIADARSDEAPTLTERIAAALDAAVAEAREACARAVEDLQGGRDVSQPSAWAMERADKLLRWRTTEHDCMELREPIALALDAAVAEEREACAKVAEGYRHSDFISREIRSRTVPKEEGNTRG